MTPEPEPEPFISSIWVFIIHLIIVVTNVLSVLFSISWVCYIGLRLKNIRKQGRREEIFNSVELKELGDKLNKYYLYLAVMIIEAIHVALRLIIYIVFTVLDRFPFDYGCGLIGEYKAYYFIESLQPFQFIWIGLSHSFALALITSMIVTMLYLRETYSYYTRTYTWIKSWVVIGIVQFLTIWVFLSIPYTALIGSALFIVYSSVDFIMLVKAARRLISILNMRLFDLQYEPDNYHRFKQSMVKLQWLGFFLLSLFIYLCGIVLAHVAIWLSISPCFFSEYYNISILAFNATQVETIANVASVAWLLDYVAIFQFDVVLLLANLFYLIYGRLSRKNTYNETRHLMEEYTNSISNRRRFYTL